MSELTDMVEIITIAWQHSKYTEEIHDALTTDTSHPEDQEARQLFLGLEWHEIPSDVLLAQYPNPFLIDDKALCYYLPAFLIAAITHPDEMLLEGLIEFQLNPPKKAEVYKCFCKRYEELTQDQASAVVQFLIYCRDKHVTYPRTVRRINDAISRYWKKLALCPSRKVDP